MPLIIGVDADTKKATAKIKKASKQAAADVKKLEKESVAAAAKMKSSFKSLAGIAGIGSVSVALGAATKQLIGFQTAMAEVSTLVDTTQVNMGELNKDILRLTTVIPRSAIDISKGLYQTLSAGITDTGEALFFLEEASKAAVAGLSDTQTAVTIAAAVMNAFGKDVKDVTNINDILFLTVKEGVTNFEQLASAMGNVVTIAAQTGVSFEEVAAATAALTKSGLKTAEAVTAIRGVLVAVLKQSSQSVRAAASLGLQFDVQALKAKGLTGFLKDVGEATQGDAEITQKLFGRVEALTAVLALAGDQSETYTTILDKMANASGTANEAFEKLNETAESQIQLFKNRLNVDLQSFSGIILPGVVFALDSFLFALSPVATLLDKYDDAVKRGKKSTDEFVESIPKAPSVPIVPFEIEGFVEELENFSVESFVEDVRKMEAALAGLGIGLEELEPRALRFRDVFAIENLDLIGKDFTGLFKEGAKATEDMREEIEGVSEAQKKAATAAGTFSQNLARALISGKGLEKSLLSAAISLGLSFIPGGSLFGGFFGHGGRAPGGFIPSIVGEGGGAEIIQSATPIRVTPLTTTNNNKFNNHFTLVFPAVRELDDFELQTNIIPKINALVQGGESRLSASEIV